MSRSRFLGIAERFARYKRNWQGETYVGKDFNGNTYYEIPADKARGIKQQRRIEGADPNLTVVPKVPAEWMTWLQKGRTNPPTEEELLKNQKVKERTLARAKEVDQAWTKEKQRIPTEIKDEAPPQSAETERVPFPKYEDLELHPGQIEYETPEDSHYGSVKNKKTF